MVAEEHLTKLEIADTNTERTRTFLEETFSLKYEADMRTIFFVGSYFVLSAFLWVQHGRLSLWLSIPIFLLVCLLSFVGAVATHNTMHCPVFTKRSLNKIFQILLTLTYGHPVSSYVPGHNLSHHKYTQQRKDVMRTAKLNYRWNLLNFIMFQPKIAPDMLKNDFKYIYLQGKLNRAIWSQSITELVILMGLQLGLVLLDYRLFFLYVFIPHFFAQWAIVTMNLLQHDGCDPNVKGYNFARNFTGEAINWIFLNNGFHTIHHMRPGLHWSLLPRYHEKLVKPYMDPALDVNLFAYIWTQFFWPGVRTKYDGTPLEFSPSDLGPDEEWIVYPAALRAQEEKEKQNATEGM